MKTFLDSSSFAKRYVEEHGSNDVETICAATTQLALSVLCVPEIISALNRRRREHMLTQLQYETAKRHLDDDVRHADIINLTPSVVESSITILEAGTVRTLDALHVACAAQWGPDLFVSSDKRQIDAARHAGLVTREV